MDEEWANIEVIPCRTRDGDPVSVIMQQSALRDGAVRYVTGSGKPVEKLDEQHFLLTGAGVALMRE